MDFHDSYERLHQQEERIKQAEETGKAFIKCLTSRLIEHAFNWNPEWIPKRASTEEKITDMVKEMSSEMLQLFGSVAYGSYEFPEDKDYSIPKPRSRKKAEKRLDDLKSRVPKENHKFMEEGFWEKFEKDKRDEDFCFEAHRLINKTLTDYYSESIMNLESTEFRQLNSFMYYLGATVFVDKCYTIMQ